MKKQLLLLASFVITLAGLCQSDSTLAPYKRFPTYPPAKILLPDSSSYFAKTDLNKKSSVIVMVFNPGCEHCQHETEAILKHIDDLKKVQIVMATMVSFGEMIAFRKRYNLDKYPNIVIGQDVHYFLPGFYNMRSLPFLAFYNKKKELISVFEGSMPIEKLLEEVKK
jgi:thiol-disulfide isomerase/thioredoxin